MKKCKWKLLKKYNDEKELHLEIEDQLYIDKVVRHLQSHGTGMMETEVIRKDLIGMSLEAREEGTLLKDRCGDIKDFGESLAAAGREENSRERMYYLLWQLGGVYTCVCLILWLELSIVKLMGTEIIQMEMLNLPSALFLLLFPVLFFLYICFWQYKFILTRKIGKVIGAFETALPFLIGVIFGYSRINFHKMPGGSLYVPNWFWLLLLPLFLWSFWVGRKGFQNHAEKIAEKYHLEF